MCLRRFFAPCALGAVVNDETLDRMKFKIIAGAANNQLAENRHGLELFERNILYAPDYVINAGGMINVSANVISVAPSHNVFNDSRFILFPAS